MKRENGVQTVEIQSAQGRIRLQAEGEFQVGERVKIFMPPGGDVRLEKAPLPAGQGDWRGVSYQMTENIATLKSLRAFEEQLVNWVAGRQPGSPGAGTAAAAAGRLLGPGSELETLMRLPLPEILKRVLAREGGREMLMGALSTLGKEAFSTLMSGLEEGSGPAPGVADGSKASLLEMLKGMRRNLENTPPGADRAMPGVPGKGMEAAAKGGPAQPGMGAFWPGGTGEGAAPWLGRVLERQDTGASLAFAGGKPLPYMQKGSGAVDSPMVRYLMDLGGRTMEVQSSQARQPGDFVSFEMERQGARMQARFLDPAQALPASLRTAFAAAPAETQAALQVATRYLAEFKGEPYYDTLVKDFGEVLAQSGRLALPEGATSLKPGNLPSQKELDNILRLFVAFPRDLEQPERQAKTWSEALRDPKAMIDLLKTLKPEADTSLLRTMTPMQLAAGPGAPGSGAPGAGASGAALPPELGALGLFGGEKGEDALVALLRKVLPEGFRSAELLDLARQPGAPGTETKEGKHAQFLLQAFAGLVPREDELREGKPNQFYFYHNQDWKGLQVTWERNKEQGSRQKRDSDTPIKVRVETQAHHMGKVDVGVVLRGNQASLDFKNQFHDVRDLLGENMPDLEKSLAILDVHIEAWTYEQMADQPTVLPTAGWVRPASLDGGNLDLMG